MKSNKTKRSKSLPSPDHLGDPLLLLEYWAAQTAEARAILADILSPDYTEQSAVLSSPSYIKDPLLLLEYWAARTSEARARVEEQLALAGLSYNMDVALREASEMVGRLEEALSNSPEAKDKLMNGELF